jgi:hypothetical protein
MSNLAVLEKRVERRVPDFHQRAACRLFPELDFVEAKTGSPQEAACRIICAACPVRLACATGALERREKWGVWGGLTYRDRKAIAARYGYEPPGDPPDHGTNARRVKWGCPCWDCKRAHAIYEFDRRARARKKARDRGVWVSPLLIVAHPVTIRHRRISPGQYLIPLPGLPVPQYAEPEPDTTGHTVLAIAA